MKFMAKKDDGLIHIFDVEAQVLISSMCQRYDHHYKEHTYNYCGDDDAMCYECVAIYKKENNMK